jgi:hypothetical protein
MNNAGVNVTRKGTAASTPAWAMKAVLGKPSKRGRDIARSKAQPAAVAATRIIASRIPNLRDRDVFMER